MLPLVFYTHVKLNKYLSAALTVKMFK